MNKQLKTVAAYADKIGLKYSHTHSYLCSARDFFNDFEDETECIKIGNFNIVSASNGLFWIIAEDKLHEVAVAMGSLFNFDIDTVKRFLNLLNEAPKYA